MTSQVRLRCCRQGCFLGCTHLNCIVLVPVEEQALVGAEKADSDVVVAFDLERAEGCPFAVNKNARDAHPLALEMDAVSERNQRMGGAARALKGQKY
jgi:hypothetical protein